jgi:hypothetical protein
MGGEYWATIDRHGRVMLETIRGDYDESAKAASYKLGTSWHALHEAGYRLRRVRVEVLTAEAEGISQGLRPTEG